MTISLRSFVAVIVPAMLVVTSVGCSTLGRGKCKSCNSTEVYPGPACNSDAQFGGGFSAPVYTPSPIPVPPASVPPAELQGTPVPPPPMGAGRPSMIQRMQGSTTAFFLNANENIRSTFRR